VVAGARSLGTGVACIAATKSKFIHHLREMLPHREDLSDKKRTVRALVPGTASPDGLLDESGIEIPRAGTW
jgi:hypothetical protein